MTGTNETESRYRRGWKNEDEGRLATAADEKTGEPGGLARLCACLFVADAFRYAGL